MFSQGDRADSVFYIQEGTVKLSAFPPGQGSRGGSLKKEHYSASSVYRGMCAEHECDRLGSRVLLRITKAKMTQVLQDEPRFSELFLKYILSHSMRVEEDLVDHLFNSSEKRLARVLLLLANFGKKGKTSTDDPSCNPRNAGGHDRHHQTSGEFLYEQVPTNSGFIDITARYKCTALC